MTLALSSARFLTIAASVAFLGSSVQGQTLAPIDIELAGNLDFRAESFGACFGLPSCVVGGITISAERREDQSAPWMPAKLYWDPIDGFGVQDGGQNDEIDFNERLVVAFEQPRGIARIWLSDLFISEDLRYGSSQADIVTGRPEDAEYAAIAFQIGGETVGNMTVSGLSRLPWAQFNQEVDLRFREDGDLRRRIVINNDVITIVVPGNDIVLRAPSAAGDVEKQGLFEGLETVEIDLTEILAEFNNAPLFEAGTTNFDIVRAIVENPDNLAEITRIAQNKRTSILMSNGEVGFDVDPSMIVDQLVFTAPFGPSNDFSVAGIVERK